MDFFPSGLYVDKPTRSESLKRSILYRIYATIVTTLVAFVVFDRTDFQSLGVFFLADIVMGVFTFYTFDRVWYAI